MQLVIIAGGKGTRLGVRDIPKPMVEIDGIPLLEHQIVLAKLYGIDDIYILSGHLSEVIIDYFGDGAALGVTINHVVERYPLGTAGSLKLLEGQLKKRFMVFYGDVVMDFDIQSFIEYDSTYNSLGTLVVHPNDHPFDSDLVELNADNVITKIIPKENRAPGFYQNMVNAAVYIFDIKIFDYITEGISQDFGKDIFLKVVESGEKLIGYVTPEYIKDMGTEDRLVQVSNDFISGKVKDLNKKNPRPAIFLDRDGVINVNMDIQINVAEFSLLDKTAKAIQQINKSRFLAIVITNQPMIAKGFISFEEVDQIHKKMDTLLGNEGAYVHKVYYCPHHPDKGFDGEIKELKVNCDCRKPKIGMFLEAQKEFNIDLGSSWMIGDSETDIQAGNCASCKTILISREKRATKANFIFPDLFAAIDFILSYGDNNDYYTNPF